MADEQEPSLPNPQPQNLQPGNPQPQNPQPQNLQPEAARDGRPRWKGVAAKGGVHLRTAGSALFYWGRAAVIDGFCVAVLWLIGLWILHVPLALLWAVIAGLMAFIPNFGGAISLIGPVLSILLSGHDMDRLLFLLGLYAVIVVLDQLVLQPMIMHRVTRVPIWASLLAPIVLGIVVPFWGVLLAPPLLAVVYAFRRPRRQAD